MTIQELVDHCKENDIPLDTQIALNAKYDYMLIKERVGLDKPYFGNCHEGTKWERENAPKDEDGDIDWENVPNFLLRGSANINNDPKMKELIGDIVTAASGLMTQAEMRVTRPKNIGDRIVEYERKISKENIDALQMLYLQQAIRLRKIKLIKDYCEP